VFDRAAGRAVRLLRDRLRASIGREMLPLYSNRHPTNPLFGSFIRAKRKHSMNPAAKTQAPMVAAFTKLVTKLA
jgi:hypothetical protein